MEEGPLEPLHGYDCRVLYNCYTLHSHSSVSVPLELPTIIEYVNPWSNWLLIYSFLLNHLIQSFLNQLTLEIIRKISERAFQHKYYFMHILHSRKIAMQCWCDKIQLIKSNKLLSLKKKKDCKQFRVKT